MCSGGSKAAEGASFPIDECDCGGRVQDEKIVLLRCSVAGCSSIHADTVVVVVVLVLAIPRRRTTAICCHAAIGILRSIITDQQGRREKGNCLFHNARRRKVNETKDWYHNGYDLSVKIANAYFVDLLHVRLPRY